jgi:hypothetical protein
MARLTQNRRNRERIDPANQDDLAFWAKQWGVTPERIVAVIETVGSKVDDVAGELGQALFYPGGPPASDANAAPPPGEHDQQTFDEMMAKASKKTP